MPEIKDKLLYSNANPEHDPSLRAKRVTTIAGANSDFYIEVAKGNVPGYQPIFIAGENTDVGNSFEIVRRQGGATYPFPTTAANMSIQSTSAADNATGTGAQLILVEWLDANYDRVTELIVPTGTTPVISTVAALRVNNFTIVQAGSNRKAEGVINILNGGDDLGQIDIGQGAMRQHVYTVPRNKKWFNLSFDPTSGRNDELEIVGVAGIGTVDFTFADNFLYQAPLIFENIGRTPLDEETDLVTYAQNTGASGSSRVSIVTQFIEGDLDEM